MLFHDKVNGNFCPFTHSELNNSVPLPQHNAFGLLLCPQILSCHVPNSCEKM